MTGFEIRRAADRAVTSTDWLESRHSFAFGPHYDPDNISFGPLIALNADVVQPGPGYVAHRHAGLEILTWVVGGVLEHEAGDVRQLRPGQLQYLSVGQGIEHAERSADDQPVQVIQMWLTGRADGDSVYRIGQIPDGSWVLAASSRRPAPVALRHVEAELHVGRAGRGESLELPGGQLHLYLVRGVVTVDGAVLQSGDALRGRAKTLVADAGSELLVWSF